MILFASVICLFFRSRPSAITRRISVVIVLAIQGVLVTWTTPHVFQKENEIVFPSIANGYTAGAIIFKIGRFFVVASIFHSFPRMVFNRVAFVMRAVRLAHSLQTETPARDYLFPKVVNANPLLVSALTLAHHEFMTPRFNRIRYYRETAEYISGFVIHFGKGI